MDRGEGAGGQREIIDVGIAGAEEGAAIEHLAGMKAVIRRYVDLAQIKEYLVRLEYVITISVGRTDETAQVKGTGDNVVLDLHSGTGYGQPVLSSVTLPANVVRTVKLASIPEVTAQALTETGVALAKVYLSLYHSSQAREPGSKNTL